MKVLPFKIPKSTSEAFRVQVDDVPDMYPYLHQDTELQLTYIKQRGGTLITGDFIGRFEEGDVFLIGANQPHFFRNDKATEKKRNALAISVFFDESTFGESFWNLPELKQAEAFFRKSAGGFRLSDKNKKLVAGKLEKLALVSGIDKLIVFLEILKSLFSTKEIMPLSKKKLNSNVKNYDGGRLNAIIEYTFKHSDRKISLEEVAGVATMTPEAFCKYFKMRTRKTYINFVNELRVSNACQLLVTTDKSISTICYQTGFNNLSNFNRIFKRVTGKTPNGYRAIVE